MSIKRERESCPNCSGSMWKSGTWTRKDGVHGQRYTCKSCGTRRAVLSNGEVRIWNVVARRRVASDLSDSDVSKLIMDYIDANQPCTIPDIKAEFGFHTERIRNAIDVITPMCPIWESDDFPIKYGIDRSLSHTFEGMLSGHVGAMSNYGHVSSLEEL